MIKKEIIWHPLSEVPDFKRGKDGILKIMLTNGQEMHPMENCTEDNFKYMDLYYCGAKAWAYYSDILPDANDLQKEARCAYEFVGDSEKIFHWLFDDDLKLIGTGNMKWGDEYTDVDRYIMAIHRGFDFYGKECICYAYPGRPDFCATIEGDPQEFVRQFVEERHIRVIPPTMKED